MGEPAKISPNEAEELLRLQTEYVDATARAKTETDRSQAEISETRAK